MNVLTTIAACGLYVGFASVELATTTSTPVTRPAPEAASNFVGTYVASGEWDFLSADWNAFATTTNAHKDSALNALAVSGESPLEVEIALFLNLHEGWDGEHGAQPNFEAIGDAIAFAKLAKARSVVLEPTLHADGSVILEVDDGAAGSLRFLGKGSISFATGHGRFGIIAFDGLSIPDEIAIRLTA
jgi:hypothetical protein